MRVAESRSRGAVLVPGVHRVIRQLEADEGPFAGALVTRGESVSVQVDCDVLTGWAGWEHAGDEHVAGPVDIVRRSDGHDALLPWCPERVAALIGRRAAADASFSAGEVSTLVASLLRGLGELGRSDGAATGDWWLTDDGRPMFVIGAGEDARVTTSRLVERVQRESSDRALSRLLAEITSGLQKSGARPGVPSRQLERWESDLLAIAAPRPIRCDAHAPERARDVDVARRVASAPETRPRSRRVREERADVRGRWSVASWAKGAVVSRLEQGRDALNAWRIGRGSRKDGRAEASARRATPSGDERPPAPRGRRVIVAGAAAAIVIGGGLLWPGGATGEPHATPERSPTAGAPGTEAAPSRTDGPVDGGSTSAPPSARPSASSDDETSGSDDPLAAARALLATITRCAETGDTACADAVAVGSSGIVEALAGGDIGAPPPELAPVDEYGDVAVIRVSASSQADAGEASAVPERMLVLVRVDGKWLVRDAYDVADQPG